MLGPGGRSSCSFLVLGVLEVVQMFLRVAAGGEFDKMVARSSQVVGRSLKEEPEVIGRNCQVVIEEASTSWRW